MKHIFPLLLSLLLFTGCSDYKRISPKDLENIYYDIFKIDEITLYEDGFSEIADTTAVYATIFNHYGYTVDDFSKSIDYYLEKSTQFDRILKRVHSRLRAEEIKVLEKGQNPENSSKAPEYQ